MVVGGGLGLDYPSERHIKGVWVPECRMLTLVGEEEEAILSHALVEMAWDVRDGTESWVLDPQGISMPQINPK